MFSVALAMLARLSVLRACLVFPEVGCLLPAKQQTKGQEARLQSAMCSGFDSTAGSGVLGETDRRAGWSSRMKEGSNRA